MSLFNTLVSLAAVLIAALAVWFGEMAAEEDPS